jgi:hypothetical protein
MGLLYLYTHFWFEPIGAATSPDTISYKEVELILNLKLSWLRLRYCATNQKVTVLIADGVLLIALWPWGSTQPLTEMSTRSIFWGRGKYGRCLRLTTVVKKSWNLNFLAPSGPPQACNGTAFTQDKEQTANMPKHHAIKLYKTSRMLNSTHARPVRQTEDSSLLYVLAILYSWNSCREQ